MPRAATSDLTVVTGAPGWLGSSLVAALSKGARFRSIEQAPGRVRCIVHPGITPTQRATLGDVEIVAADLRDPRALEGACEGATTVVHAAGLVHPRRVEELFEVNVAGTRNLLASAMAAGARRFVLVSSNSPAGVNVSASQLMTERDPPRPYLSYGLSKLQAEWSVTEAHRSGCIESVVVRPCWFYGPNQPARQTRFFRMIRGGRPIVLGRGDNLRSMSYIDNVVQGLLLAMREKIAAGRTYWIADRRPYSFIEILQTVGNLLDVEVRPRYLPSFGCDVARLADSLLQMAGLYNQEIHVAGELAASIAVSIEAAERDLGYDPEVDLEVGMRRSIEWCRANGVAL